MNIEESWLGYKTMEITSSSIHSYTFPQWDNFKKNPRRINSKSTAKHNFISMDLDSSNNKMVGSLKSLGHKGKIIFDQEFDLF